MRTALGWGTIVLLVLFLGMTPGRGQESPENPSDRLWERAEALVRENIDRAWVPGTAHSRLFTFDAGGSRSLFRESTVYRSPQADGSISTRVEGDSGPFSMQSRDRSDSLIARHMAYFFVEGGPFARADSAETSVQPEGFTVFADRRARRYSFRYVPEGEGGLAGSVLVEADSGLPLRLTARPLQQPESMRDTGYRVRYNPQRERWYPLEMVMTGEVRILLVFHKGFEMHLEFSDYFRSTPEAREKALTPEGEAEGSHR
jgi:hypothetical protein